eukprot:CAMPEP_0182860426 /NCGR_PEP_ID=MMETSP0034_2-20130328/4910_1 /TAXON_ID=156128 /ORGANISM="Nephroselmis pyriformis, Strain CCMP717" /LENGTH=79 /DNA_ID=CAMNT_0024992217 /DNA_START=14 /DNA_END=250 /DNA_ORIENTATION=-
MTSPTRGMFCFSRPLMHKRVEKAIPGDNVGMCIKGLEKQNMPRVGMCIKGLEKQIMPRVGDVMIYKTDTTLKAVKSFTA